MTTADSQTLSHLNLCYAGSLRRAARAISRLYDEMLRPSGLRATQFSVLRHLQGGTYTLTQLADVLVMDRTTLGRNLMLLERDGLVQLRVGKDRRERELALTERGLRTLEAAYPLWRQAQAQIAQRLGPNLSERLHEDAAAVVNCVRSD